ncbi:MAG: hypothetical protein ACP5P9_06650 [Acidimicrobiales bacterium]
MNDASQANAVLAAVTALPGTAVTALHGTAVTALPGTAVTVSCPGGLPGAAMGVGLKVACGAASSVGTAAGSLVGGAVGFGATQVLDGLAGWVASGAEWLLSRVAGLLLATTRVDLGAGWFTSHLAVMAGLAATVVLPLLVLGVIQALHAQSALLLVRTALVNVPAALVLTGVAVKLVTVGLVVTDAMSTAVAGGTGAGTAQVLGRIVDDLDTAALGGQAGVPEFLVLVVSVVIVLATFTVWVELLLRAAALYVAVLFLPLALATLAWPAVSHWCRRLAETIAALVLAKFVVVAVLSLGAGAVAAGSGATPQGPSSLTAVVGGAALLLLASLSPWALLRLLPFAEAGAVAHLDGVAHRGVRAVTGAPRTLVHAALGASAIGGALASDGSGLLAGALGSAVGAADEAVASGAGASDAGDAGPGAGGQTGGAPAGSTGTGPRAGGGRPGSATGVHPASTWARAGYGAGRVPGDDIPSWAPHPGATAVLQEALDGTGRHQDDAEGGEPPASSGAGGAQASFVARQPTPPDDGAVTARAGGAPTAWIAHDRLGPVLVSTGPWPPQEGRSAAEGSPGASLPVWAIPGTDDDSGDGAELGDGAGGASDVLD